MRTNFRVLAAALTLSVAAFFSSCKKEAEVKPEEDGNVEAAATLPFGVCGSDITLTTNRTLSAANTYILRGIVRVGAGTTLTIEPGTLILGECGGTIVVERGGQINANGTPSAPIRFSSNKPVGQRRPGDWGGIVILGRAPNNQGTDIQIEGVSLPPGSTVGRYGGNNPDDNSGVFRYVRIEYPGTELGEGNEINGLTMGSVGRGTQIDHVQVLYAQDDGFEWFGGNVDCRYLYAFGCSDDDFDTDFGFTGRIQFAAGVKTVSSEPGTGASNGFESDNDAAGSGATPLTAPRFANVTLSGPCGDDALLPVFGQGVLARRNTALQLRNSVISDWNEGVDRATANAAAFFTRISSDAVTGIGAGTGITFLANVLPGDCPRPAAPGAPNLTRNPDLGSTVPVADGFFVNTAYRGAFSSTRANNDGWDLASENPAFNWLSFKAFGN